MNSSTPNRHKTYALITTDRRDEAFLSKAALYGLSLEQGVIGALLRAASKGHNLLPSTLPILKGDGFHELSHQVTYEAMTALAELGEMPTVFAVVDQLQATRALELVEMAVEQDAFDYLGHIAETSAISTSQGLLDGSAAIAHYALLRRVSGILHTARIGGIT